MEKAAEFLLKAFNNKHPDYRIEMYNYIGRTNTDIVVCAMQEYSDIQNAEIIEELKEVRLQFNEREDYIKYLQLDQINWGKENSEIKARVKVLTKALEQEKGLLVLSAITESEESDAVRFVEWMFDNVKPAFKNKDGENYWQYRSMSLSSENWMFTNAKDWNDSFKTSLECYQLFKDQNKER